MTRRIYDEFYNPRTLVAVAAVGEASEAFLVRSILESLNAAVLLHLIGTPEDFLRVIGQGQAAPGVMTITTMLVAVTDGTEVSIVCENVPEGISAQDHQVGMTSTLANLAAFVERP